MNKKVKIINNINIKIERVNLARKTLMKCVYVVVVAVHVI